MYKIKSFVKNDAIIDGEYANVIRETMCNEPCVLVSAKELYRIIHGDHSTIDATISRFIKKLDSIKPTFEVYNNTLQEEIRSIAFDTYVRNELEAEAHYDVQDPCC